MCVCVWAGGLLGGCVSECVFVSVCGIVCRCVCVCVCLCVSERECGRGREAVGRLIYFAGVSPSKGIRGIASNNPLVPLHINHLISSLLHNQF